MRSALGLIVKLAVSIEDLTLCVVVTMSDTTIPDLNRMYDAWIPIDSTRRVLAQAANPDEVFTVPADQLIRPRIAMADTQVNQFYF